MNGWLIIIGILSTIAGWLISRLSIALLVYPTQPRKIFGIRYQGLLPKRKDELIKQVFMYLAERMLLQKEFQHHIANSGHFEKLLPEIENHIDDFLRHRLTEKMPMVGMFIGENTTRQLKEIFMEELKEIFPAVMTSYIKTVTEQRALVDIIAQKMKAVQMKDLERSIYRKIMADLRYITIIGTLAGFLVGVLQIVIIVLFTE